MQDPFTQAALAFNANQENAPEQEKAQVINPVAETKKTESTTQKQQTTMETKQEQATQAAAQSPKGETKSNKLHEIREHLKIITNGLVDMAKAAGRTDYRTNQLLQECYNLVGATLDTFDGWKEKGFSINKGQHAYLFWGEPITSKTGIRYCPVKFLFAQEQVTKSLAV